MPKKHDPITASRDSVAGRSRAEIKASLGLVPSSAWSNADPLIEEVKPHAREFVALVREVRNHWTHVNGGYCSAQTKGQGQNSPHKGRRV